MIARYPGISIMAGSDIVVALIDVPRFMIQEKNMFILSLSMQIRSGLIFDRSFAQEHLERCYKFNTDSLRVKHQTFLKYSYDGSYVMNENPRYSNDEENSVDTGDNNIDEEVGTDNEEDVNENQGTPRQGITIIEDTGCSSSKSYFFGIPLLLFGYIRRRKN